MPKVGNKHYAYTAAGIAKAKNAAKKLGTKLKMHTGGLGFTTTDNLKKKKVKGTKTAQLKTKGMDALNPVIKLADEQRRKRLMQSLQTEYEKSAKSKRGRRG
tara:strand:+ start:388 stop:693 length:306 start_codon:yes stop_codon:yes gene_type:complete